MNVCARAKALADGSSPPAEPSARTFTNQGSRQSGVTGGRVVAAPRAYSATYTGDRKWQRRKSSKMRCLVVGSCVSPQVDCASIQEARGPREKLLRLDIFRGGTSSGVSLRPVRCHFETEACSQPRSMSQTFLSCALESVRNPVFQA